MKLIDGRKDAQEAARREREIERNGLFLCAYANILPAIARLAARMT